MKIFFRILFISYFALTNLHCYAAYNTGVKIYQNDFGEVIINNNRVKVNVNIGAHSCLVEGDLEYSSPNLAFIKEVNTEDNKKKIVQFKFDDNMVDIKIIEGNQLDWCGVGTDFEGEYFIKGMYKTSFKYSDNNSNIEKIISHNKILSNADVVLDRLLYMPTPKQKQQQKKWLKKRDTCEQKNNIEDCLLQLYLDRIYELENQVLISNKEKIDKKKGKYNYHYNLQTAEHDNFFYIITDPLITNHLSSLLSPEDYNIFYNGLIVCNKEVSMDDNGKEIINIWGGAPGLFGLMESALALGNNDKTWLSFIKQVDDKASHIVIFIPSGTKYDQIPKRLTDWVNDLIKREPKYKNNVEVINFPSV